MGRPRRQEPARYVHLTLEPSDFDLLDAYVHQVGAPAATLARGIVVDVLRGAQLPDGSVDPSLIESTIRALRGEPIHRPQEVPRWEWSLEAILADRRWWDRWLPELNELMGRDLMPKTAHRAYDDQRRRIEPSPVADSRGYADLMEFLFPLVTRPRGGAISWRSLEYPATAAPQNTNEAAPALSHIWESVIRHVTKALCALEKTAEPRADPVSAILTQDHIRVVSGVVV
jgi:hypothetical protein